MSPEEAKAAGADVMEGKVTRCWFVASGPDSRHLIDVSVHDKLREAKMAYASATGRAKQIFSMDFRPWENGFNKRVLSEVLN